MAKSENSKIWIVTYNSSDYPIILILRVLHDSPIFPTIRFFRLYDSSDCPLITLFWCRVKLFCFSTFRFQWSSHTNSCLVFKLALKSTYFATNDHLRGVFSGKCSKANNNDFNCEKLDILSFIFRDVNELNYLLLHNVHLVNSNSLFVNLRHKR